MIVTEARNVQLVIAFLGLLTLTVVAGGIYLTAVDHTIPDALIALGGTSVGALAGILSKTSTGPQEVQVVNQDEAPVPVEQLLPEPDDIPTTGAPKRKGKA